MNKWVVGARPKTLPAAIVPVLVGTGVAAHSDETILARALGALFVALALQIGVNYANDYSDGVRGTDENRTGPVRLVGSGLASAAAVKRAALICFGAGAVVGLAVALVTSLWLVVLGAICILAAWYYTGGKSPYGYRGLGEISVFVFFGLAAVMGTAFVQMERVTMLSFVAAIPVGLLAVSLLVVNNLRDRENDALAGKRTLAVWLGDARTRKLFAFCVYAPFFIVALMSIRVQYVLTALIAAPLAVYANQPVRSGATGRELIAVLQQTGKLQLAFGILFTIGLAF